MYTNLYKYTTQTINQRLSLFSKWKLWEHGRFFDENLALQTTKLKSNTPTIYTKKTKKFKLKGYIKVTNMEKAENGTLKQKQNYH